MTSDRDDMRVRVPADIDRPDTLLAGLNARQLAILTVTALALYGGYAATRPILPAVVYVAVATPVAVAAVVLAVGRRDGLSADRLALAAVRWRRRPRRLVPAAGPIRPAPGRVGSSESLPAALRLPATAIGDHGVIELGADGAALICRCSALTFALRTSDEQHALLAAFGRYLNALTSEVQVVIRTRPADLSGDIAALRDAAPGLPHPALEQAARDHATFLSSLTTEARVLERDVLLVLRDRTTSGATDRLTRQAAAAADALAAAGVTVTILRGQETAAVLAGAVGAHPTHGRAADATVITGRPT